MLSYVIAFGALLCNELCIMHYELCIMHYELCIMNYELCIMNYLIDFVNYALRVNHGHTEVVAVATLFVAEH